MEFVFGISDESPKRTTNGIEEPRWEDEQITACSSHTFLQLMAKLCECAVRKRREVEDDHGIHQHLWKLRLQSLENFNHANHNSFVEETLRRRLRAARRNNQDDENDDESEDSDDENRYRSPIVIPCPQNEEFEREENFDDDQIISSTQHLSSTYLPQNTIITLEYDYGSTTTLYLKVLHCRAVTAVRPLPSYSTNEANEDELKKSLRASPAFNLPKEQQIDTFYPNFSKIMMGQYVPIIQPKEDDEDPHGYGNPTHVTSCISIGKRACISTERDLPFCSVDGRTGNPLMESTQMKDLEEFFDTAERAWTPRNAQNDPDKLSNFRFEWITRRLIEADDDEQYSEFQKIKEADSGFGPKLIIVRGKKDRKPSGFDFEKVFPLTYGMLKGDYFRWFQLKNGNVLHVLAGRATGPFHIHFKQNQILKTWKYKFESFHEVLCAVELSWEWKGKPMTVGTYLADSDSFLGPSNPSKDPPLLGKKEDCVTISAQKDMKKRVTALAITEEDGIAVLYSGHDDGTLSKWRLSDNQLVWSKVIYKQGQGERTVEGEGVTFGVAGIVIRPDPEISSEHEIYTWTHAFDDYNDEADRTASELTCWSCRGNRVKTLTCDVGPSEEEDDAHPTIGAVVFSDLYYKCKDQVKRWIPCIVIGMQCVAQSSLNWRRDYSNYDLDYAREHSSEGNIRVIQEYSEDELDSWVEGMCMIKSLTVRPRKYVISLSYTIGCGDPEAMVLWDAKNPGCPLDRFDFCRPGSPPDHRLHGVCGMHIQGESIILADNYGNRIAAAAIEEDDDDQLEIVFNGYGEVQRRHEMDDAFVGCMATSGEYSVMTNEGDMTAWVFKTSDCGNHDQLDSRKGGLLTFHRMYNDDDDDDESSPHFHGGRKIAKGMVRFPRYGISQTNRKRKKAGLDPVPIASIMHNRSGHGGPVAITMRGQWLVAGYANGTITRAPLLPSEFKLPPNASKSANHLSSTSDLPSDTWNNPILELDDDDDDIVQPNCQIQ